MYMNKKVFYVLLSFIVVMTFGLRLYKFNSPIADWHSWRQVDTAAVARNFEKFGFDPLKPRYDDLSNIQSGKDNPQGYRMVEFPIYQSLAYGFYTLTGVFTIEQSLRIISIVSSVITGLLLMLIIRSLAGEGPALATGLIYALLPYSIFYGRSILPEPLMVALSVAAVYFALKEKALFYFLSALFASLALLTKPFAAFLLLPIAWMLLRKKKIVIGILYASIAFVPFLFWRDWITNFPEGVPASDWLFNAGNIRFKGAWFHWLFAERISTIILGHWGVAFIILGFLFKLKKKTGVLFWWLIGSLTFLVVIARGNVQHDYYQQLLLPILSVLAGLGIHFLVTYKALNIFSRFLLIVILSGFTIAFSWFEVRGFFWINRPEIVEAGRTADRLLPPDAKVIASYNGDTTFLYQTGRQGWPLGFEIDDKIAKGATHYVTVSVSGDGETDDLASRYKVLERNDRFAIIDLTQPVATKSSSL